MSKQQLNLKKLERRAFRTNYQDGLQDIMIGLIFLVMSSVPWMEEIGVQRPYYYLIAFALLLPVGIGIPLFKTHYTIPRIGMVSFSPQRKTRTFYARIALIVMFIVTVILVVLTARRSFDGSPLARIPNIFMPWAIYVVILSLLAFILDYPRLYAYGWLLALEYPLGNYIEAQTGLIFPNGNTIVGLVILLIGLIIFSRFLRRYPHPIHEANAGGEHNG